MSEFLHTYYPKYEHILAAAMLFLAMLGMGAQLTLKDFASVFRVPKGFAVGMLLQVLIVPVVAGLLLGASHLIPGIEIHTGIAVGIALVAAMPGGSMSNIFTYLGKGNAALSVALTCGATLTCLVSTPFVFSVLARRHMGDIEFVMPYMTVIREILLYLLLPLSIGMLVGVKAPKIKDGFGKWAIRGSLLMILLIVVGSFGAGRLKLKEYGLIGPLAVVIFCIAAQQISVLTTAIARFPLQDRIAIVVEITIRNTLLALLLKASIFTPARLAETPELQGVSDGVLFVVLFYGGVAMLAALGPVSHYRKKISKGETGTEADDAAPGDADDGAGAASTEAEVTEPEAPAS